MTKKILIAIIILFLIILAAEWRKTNKIKSTPTLENIKKIEIERVEFEVELALTNEEKRRGLSGRTSLCDQCGMLFIYNLPGYHSFWMKDTLVPLDIIWLDQDWLVVDYLAFAQPQGAKKIGDLPIYRPKKPALVVLEVPGGTTRKIRNFKIGTEIKILQ